MHDDYIIMFRLREITGRIYPSQMIIVDRSYIKDVVDILINNRYEILEIKHK